MLAALLGLCGVLVGAVLTQLLAVSAERHRTRLEAMVEVAVASSRVLGAHERLYEMLFLGGEIPPVASERANAALKERSEAHYDWRSARSRLEILIAEDAQLYDAMKKFEEFRDQATDWVRAYVQQGTSYDYTKHLNSQVQAWNGMRTTRHELMEISRVRAERDSRGWLRWLRAGRSS